jgi:Mn2+/Fe2+ NRAMP family transporter
MHSRRHSKKDRRSISAAVVDVLVTIAASALAAATSVTVTALTRPAAQWSSDRSRRLTSLFGLTANAAAGATTLAVSALPTALAGGETGTYHGGDKVLKLAADAAARCYDNNC